MLYCTQSDLNVLDCNIHPWGSSWRYCSPPVSNRQSSFAQKRGNLAEKASRGRTTQLWNENTNYDLKARLPDGKTWSLPFLGLRKGGGRGGAIQGKEGIKFSSEAYQSHSHGPNTYNLKIRLQLSVNHVSFSLISPESDPPERLLGDALSFFRRRRACAAIGGRGGGRRGHEGELGGRRRCLKHLLHFVSFSPFEWHFDLQP